MVYDFMHNYRKFIQNNLKKVFSSGIDPIVHEIFYGNNISTPGFVKEESLSFIQYKIKDNITIGKICESRYISGLSYDEITRISELKNISLRSIKRIAKKFIDHKLF